MKRRIMALLLVLAMTVSMVSCSNQKSESSSNTVADVSALFDKVEGMKESTVEFEMNVDMSGKNSTTNAQETIKVSLKGSSFTLDENKTKATLSYKLGDSKEYKALTTCIVDDKTAYIDFASLKTAAVDICNTFKVSNVAALLSVLPSANYIKLDADTMKSYLKKLGADEITTESLGNEPTTTEQKVVLTVIEYVLKTLQDTVKDVKPAIITGSDSKFEFHITKENLSAACEALLALDLNAKYDEMTQKVKEIGNTDDYVSGIQSEKTKIISGAKDAINEVMNEKDNFTAFDIAMSVGVDGEAGNRKVKEKIDFNVQEENGKVAVSINATIGEGEAKEQTITIPTDCTEFTDYMTQIYRLMNY